MKSHITKMHTKVEKTKTEKRKNDKETNEEEEEERRRTLTARMVEKYGGEGGSSSQPIASIEDILNYGKEKTTNKTVENMDTVMEVVEGKDDGEDVAVMKEDIKELKAENAELKTKMEQMKIELETKHDLLEAKTGRCDKLEEEKTIMTGQYKELHVIAAKMLKETDEMKASGGNGETTETKRKLKKANDDLKSAEKNLAESIKQCGEEANMRHKAEAELARNAGLVDLMTRHVTMLQEGSGSSQGAAGGPAPAGRLEGRREDNNREEGRNWKSNEGCPRTNCQHSHPPGRGRMAAGAGQQDCYFWLAGSCRFSEAECSKGKHSQAKFGSRPFRRRAGSAEGGRTSPGAGGPRQDPAWGAWEARQPWEARQHQDFGVTQATAPGQVATGGMAAQQVQQQLQLLQQALQQPGLLQLQQGGNFRC